jgi:hypothetical protein
MRILLQHLCFDIKLTEKQVLIGDRMGVGFLDVNNLCAASCEDLNPADSVSLLKWLAYSVSSVDSTVSAVISLLFPANFDLA